MIRSDIFDDIYFSDVDGAAETDHVFLQGNDLPERFRNNHGRFTVAETGFGTGLNILSAWALFDEMAPVTTHPDARLDFVSFELYPLHRDQIASALEPWAARLGQARIDAMLRDYPIRATGWHWIELSPRVTLTLIFDDVNAAISRVVVPGGVDAWFLDGFAPAKNPQMWTDTVFNAMARLCAPGGTFATFTAAGFVKRGLMEAGFEVEKRKGFGRKRDMLVGTFDGQCGAGQKPNDAPANPVRKVAIIGGGLAGTAMARELSRDGFTPVIFEQDDIAAGASGNACGLINPRISAHRTPESDFYSSGFARAIRVAASYEHARFVPCGNLHLIKDADKEKRFTACQSNWMWNADHMRIVDAAGASALAGVDVAYGAMVLPDGGRVSPRELCGSMAGGVERRGGVDLAAITPHEGGGENGWVVEGELFDAVILAAGIDCLNAPYVSDLPLHTVRGQIMQVRESQPQIKTNLCFGGYISTPEDGTQVMGSTFQKWLDGTDVREEDNEYILNQARETLPKFVPGAVVGARASLRCAASDRFPVVGRVPGAGGMYISTAHGSHGIVSAIMGARIIADMIGGGVWCLPGDTVDALCPGRFARRKKQ